MKALYLQWRKRVNGVRLFGIPGFFIKSEVLDLYLKKEKVARQNKQRRKFNNKKPKLYQALIQRQRGKCKMCGATGKLTIDHIIRLADGGSSKRKNLQLLCEPCHRRKDNP